MIFAGAALCRAAGAPPPDRLGKGHGFHSRIGVFGEVGTNEIRPQPRGAARYYGAVAIGAVAVEVVIKMFISDTRDLCSPQP
jgi:hypothetical protein